MQCTTGSPDAAVEVNMIKDFAAHLWNSCFKLIRRRRAREASRVGDIVPGPEHRDCFSLQWQKTLQCSSLVSANLYG
jgi:hypothetical protein